MKLVEISAPDFDLAMTLDSGQVFHWEKLGNGVVGTIGDLPVYVEQCAEILKVRRGATPTRSPRRPLPGIIADYFALDHPLAEICASFPTDPAMSAARHFCRGLRIIRQPKWECLATFICSSMKQVLLRVTTVFAKIGFRKFAQPLHRHLPFPRKIFLS